MDELQLENAQLRLASSLAEMRLVACQLELQQTPLSALSRAEAERDAAEAEAAAALAHVHLLEDELENAVDLIALYRRRAEAAEDEAEAARRGAVVERAKLPSSLHAALAPEISACVAAAEALPAAARRSKLRSLRLKMHPDHLGRDLPALAHATTQLLNDAIAGMQRRLALDDSDV